ncbi:MAG: hypothetical protein M9922_14705 [Microthrixaceae bacterium]|nr:hypothetical protein [Microthrixaceae bacterium]MCO5322638.1 hypothetical protein [Microthrixaceae bacterium]
MPAATTATTATTARIRVRNSLNKSVDSDMVCTRHGLDTATAAAMIPIASTG